MEKCCSLNEYIEIRDRKKQVKPGKLEQSHLMQRESKHLWSLVVAVAQIALQMFMDIEKY